MTVSRDFWLIRQCDGCPYRFMLSKETEAGLSNSPGFRFMKNLVKLLCLIGKHRLMAVSRDFLTVKWKTNLDAMVVLIGDNNPVLVVTGNGSWSLEFTLCFSTLSKFVLEPAFFIIDFNSVVGSIGHHDQTWFSAGYTPWAAKLTPGLPFRPECGYWHSDFSVVATHANINLKRKKKYN